MRPRGIVALVVFFALAATISSLTALALAFPGGVLEPIWRLKPEAGEALKSLGPWAVALMAVVSLACAGAAIGLWRGTRWGWWLAIAVLALNLVGDVVNATAGHDPRSWIGVPVGVAVLAYLGSRGVRRYVRGTREARTPPGGR